MSTATTHLNLARKWRSKQFDQIVGQDLSVRMLKNSLYLNHFFPVYLFSGQRGCGKTTTARVFASAINCEKLDAFKLEPKKSIIPCLSCVSCQAMLAGKHPDFIEMDAASHTGVDNVRNIIDAASLMPIMGRKKIYLIDEAHMLSKAAFNAFLKIMEEPPASVLFILATTDSQKIIDTVRSRCFQLFFKPIDSDVLLKHLEDVCKQEGIAYEIAGLQMIIKETEGSARDALNMLETVRFSAAQVTQHAVFQVLGHVQEEQVIALLEAVLLAKQHRIVELLKTIDTSQRSISFLWQSFLQLLHTCIWIKHDVQPDQFVNHIQKLKQLIRPFHWLQLHAYLHICYQNEQTFLKTVNQRAFFEMILLQLSVQQKATEGNDSGSGFSSMPGIVSPTVSDVGEDDESDDQDDDEEEEEESDDDLAHFNRRWATVITHITTLGDPVLTSVFKQAQFKSYDQISGKLELVLNRRFTFFQDHLDNTKPNWYRLIQEQFGAQLVCDFQFTGVEQEPSVKRVEAVASPISLPKREHPKQQVGTQYNTRQGAARDANSFARYNGKKKEHMGPTLDIKDKELWKKTHMVLQHFPGTVHEIQQVKT
jgi:DNA polymerase-3 subunit gamma/tau